MVDPTVNFYWSSQEWLVTVAQSRKPNSDWLMSVWWDNSREAWRSVARRLAGWALRQMRLVEEELLARVEAAGNSLGGILWEARVVQV